MVNVHSLLGLRLVKRRRVVVFLLCVATESRRYTEEVVNGWW